MAGGSVNRVFLVGRLGKDPEIRTVKDDMRIGNLTLATSESWKGKDGERQEKTEWHRIVILSERICDVAERYLKKGALVGIEGQLQTRKYQDQQGNEKFTTEVVIGRFNGQLTMLGSASDGQAESGVNGQRAPAARPAAPARAPARAAAPARSGGPSWDEPAGGGDLDDEIPFGPCWQ